MNNLEKLKEDQQKEIEKQSSLASKHNYVVKPSQGHKQHFGISLPMHETLTDLKSLLDSTKRKGQETPQFKYSESPESSFSDKKGFHTTHTGFNRHTLFYKTQPSRAETSLQVKAHLSNHILNNILNIGDSPLEHQYKVSVMKAIVHPQQELSFSKRLADTIKQNPNMDKLIALHTHILNRGKNNAG